MSLALNSLQALARNHLRRPRPARITIHHDESHPSHLDLPITRGNYYRHFLFRRRYQLLWTLPLRDSFCLGVLFFAFRPLTAMMDLSYCHGGAVDRKDA